MGEPRPVADGDDGPDAREPRPGEPRRWEVHPPRPSVPRSFQTRLTVAFLGVVALTLGLVTPVVINRLDDVFRSQEEQALKAHAAATAEILVRFISDEIGPTQGVVVKVNGRPTVNPKVVALLLDQGILEETANNVAQADVTVVFGSAHLDGGLVLDPDPSLVYSVEQTVPPAPNQFEDPFIRAAVGSRARQNDVADWGLQVTLSRPYTSRANTLAAVTGLLLVMALAAFMVAVLVAAFIASRFTTPVTRLTEASRRVAAGDLTSRVNLEESSGALELQQLALEFNAMAERLEESVAFIRRDRDRSRDFLADVSHELRTPIAATRTFIELLQGPAGLDREARTEFLDSSAVQLDRLDWLAQNLLELSKLESGLVLLDLRPDDIRGTIESAVEQQLAAAERKGIRLDTSLPDRPLRIQHDSPRIGQVVSNLVGNALKFTPRGGEVHVTARRQPDGGARIEVTDSGVGIHPAEMPRIFERFYRGSEANEARSTGSGLGLAIVKSIVDMHHGTIEVESRVKRGSRFVVTLPRDPREPPAPSAPAPSASPPAEPPPPAGA